METFLVNIFLFFYFQFVLMFLLFLEAAPVIDSSSNEEEDEEDGCVRCLRNKEDDQVSYTIIDFLHEYST